MSESLQPKTQREGPAESQEEFMKTLFDSLINDIDDFLKRHSEGQAEPKDEEATTMDMESIVAKLSDVKQRMQQQIEAQGISNTRPPLDDPNLKLEKPVKLEAILEMLKGQQDEDKTKRENVGGTQYSSEAEFYEGLYDKYVADLEEKRSEDPNAKEARWRKTISEESSKKLVDILKLRMRKDKDPDSESAHQVWQKAKDDYGELMPSESDIINGKYSLDKTVKSGLLREKKCSVSKLITALQSLRGQRTRLA